MVLAERLIPKLHVTRGEGRAIAVRGHTVGESLPRWHGTGLFLRTVRWLVQPGGRCQLTNAGRDAIDDLFFNRILLDAIETHVLGQGVTFAFLDQVVKELLADMLQPTPPRIKGRAAMKGLVVDLSPATLLAFKVLGSTGKFAKGSADAIYPSV